MKLFFDNNLEQQIYVWTYLHKYYPEFKTCGMHYRDFIREIIDGETIVLDAGCGAGGIIGEFKTVPKKIIGADIDAEALARNTVISEYIEANLAALPLGDNSVDVIVSQYVLEHLEKPEAVFAEFRRILKPGGSLIFITPNIYNPVMLLSAMSPFVLHKWLRKKLLKKQDAPNRTRYRANTASKLKFLAKQAGLAVKYLNRAGNPEYFAFAKPLVVPAIFLEKWIDNRILGFFKMYLVGSFVKK